MAEDLLNRILFVSGLAEPRGTSTYTSSLLKALADRGCDCVLVALEGAMVAEYEKTVPKLHVLPKIDKPRSPFFPKQQLTQIASQASPSIVHIQSQHALAAGLVCADAAKVPAVLSVHMPLKRRGLRRAITSVDAVIAVSQAVREDLVNNVKVPKEMIRVIPNGLDVRQYKESTRRGETGVPIVATAGPLEPMKAQADFVKAAKMVIDAGHNIQFLLIGDGREEGSLRQLATDLGLQKNLTFVTGVTNYRQSIGTCDVFVLPSLQEGLGLSVLQAMAFGKPVVTTNAGGLCLLVRDGENGLMVNRSDPDAIAAAITRLIETPDLARDLGERARRFVEAEFSITACVDKTLACFRDVLTATADR